MNQPTPAVPRLAGALLTVGALGFIAVFTFLAVRFGYPEVLDRSAAEVLPALVGGGSVMRSVWAVYAVIPVTIVVTALLVHDGLPFSNAANRLVTLSGIVAGVSMSIGLTRWPTLQWVLGQAWISTSDPSVHASLAAVFDGLNVSLGNVVGEFLGEVGLSGWFLGVGLAARRTWSGRATVLLAALMLVGAFRNVVPATERVTDVTNGLLPLVMVWLGMTWLLRGLRSPRALVAAADIGRAGAAG